MHKLLIVIICTVLFACSSGANKINYYLLYTSEDVVQSQPSNGLAKIELAKVEVANYLRQSNLVIQIHSNEIHYSHQDVWAEDVQIGIGKALLAALNKSAHEFLFVNFNDPEHNQANYQLRLQVDHFLATDDSKVIAAGKYWLINKTSNELKLTKDFYIQQKLVHDGYPNAVRQLRSMLTALGQQINQDLTEVKGDIIH